MNYIPSLEQQTYVFNKPLCITQFQFYRHKFNVICIPLEFWRRDVENISKAVIGNDKDDAIDYNSKSNISILANATHKIA